MSEEERLYIVPSFRIRYKSTLVTELVGVVLKEGKKTIAEQIVYTALDELNKKLDGKESALKNLNFMENIKPRLK